MCDDERKLYVPVGCGHCIECLNKKKREWQVRMTEEIKSDNTGKFITLTLSEEELGKLEIEIEKECKIISEKLGKHIEPEANMIATLAMRRFLERWRKEKGKSVKHWFITELGHNGTERLHMHGILFTKESNEFIKKKWMYGDIWVGSYVNERTINYIMKYVTKIDETHKGFKGKILCSKGLGEKYINKWDAEQNKYREGGRTVETYRLNNGQKTSMPIYLRNKIYSEEEREKLWVEKLDSQTRYVMGQKIDVSTKEGEEKYERAREYNLEKYSNMGFGTTEWNKKNYKARNLALKNLQNKKK